MTALPGKLLGIDHGQVVIGIAVSDALRMLARPLGRMTRSTRAQDFAQINAVLDEENAVAIVVGLPETSEDFDGASQATSVRNWAARLAGQVPVPVYLWDETLSSFEAEAIAQARGTRKGERIDDYAAAIILQGFLDAHPPETPLPTPVKPRRKGQPGPGVD